MTDINTIVQLILLSIWVGGFDLLDFLSTLLFLILGHLTDSLTSPRLKKERPYKPKFSAIILSDS